MRKVPKNTVIYEFFCFPTAAKKRPNMVQKRLLLLLAGNLLALFCFSCLLFCKLFFFCLLLSLSACFLLPDLAFYLAFYLACSCSWLSSLVCFCSCLLLVLAPSCSPCLHILASSSLEFSVWHCFSGALPRVPWGRRLSYGKNP